MKVTQHSPAFDIPRFQGELGSIAELTHQGWVRDFWAAQGFSQFVRTPDGESGFYLMAEFDGGERFLVVARLEGPDVEDLTRALPLWKGP